MYIIYTIFNPISKERRNASQLNGNPGCAASRDAAVKRVLNRRINPSKRRGVQPSN